MRFFYHFIAWTSMALVLGPLAFLLFVLWEICRLPHVFTFEEDGP